MGSFDLSGIGSIPVFLGDEGTLTSIIHPIKMILWFRHVSYGIGGSPDKVIGIEMCHRHSARVIGRKFFHSRCISWSYRNRG